MDGARYIITGDDFLSLESYVPHIGDDEYAREVVFCESCCFYCEEDWEGVCSLLSLFAEGGRVVFRVLPSDFFAHGAQRGGNNGA